MSELAKEWGKAHGALMRMAELISSPTAVLEPPTEREATQDEVDICKVLNWWDEVGAKIIVGELNTKAIRRPVGTQPERNHGDGLLALAKWEAEMMDTESSFIPQNNWAIYCAEGLTSLDRYLRSNRYRVIIDATGPAEEYRLRASVLGRASEWRTLASGESWQAFCVDIAMRDRGETPGST